MVEGIKKDFSAEKNAERPSWRHAITDWQIICYLRSGEKYDCLQNVRIPILFSGEAFKNAAREKARKTSYFIML